MKNKILGILKWLWPSCLRLFAGDVAQNSSSYLELNEVVTEVFTYLSKEVSDLKFLTGYHFKVCFDF